MAIGWAVKPYQPFEMVGDAPFSIGIKSDGFARIHRGDGTRSFKMCRPLKTNDVVGAGYERNPQDQIITFFFTLNGQRLPPVPDEDAFFLVNDVKRHHLDAMRLLGQHRGNVVWSVSCRWPRVFGPPGSHVCACLVAERSRVESRNRILPWSRR